MQSFASASAPHHRPKSQQHIEPPTGPGRRVLLGAAGAGYALGLLGTGRTAAGQAPPPAGATPPAACGAAAPAARADGWAVATSEEVGLDPRRLCATAERLESAPDDNVHAVLVARRGRLAFERYFTGEDGRWGRVEFGPDTLHDLRGATTTVIGLLVGAAIDRRLLEGVDEPVMRFFPEHADLRTPERKRIRLRHLLTMSDGFDWDEVTPYYSNPPNTEQQMNLTPDPYRFVLERPVAAPPGERFNYNGDATALLGAILQKATGRPLDAFAREALWQPLGITEAEWMRYPSGQGDVVAPWGLRLQPRDFAKVGQLFLSDGAWHGT
jgi:CubicO group peptidase (beta-lactamase class C family)